MLLSPVIRKISLTAHITFSVGWLGAVAGFLALAITGISSQDKQLVRSAYLAMEAVGWFVIVPFCIGSLLSGLIQALGSPWGLLKHYWVLTKFVVTVLSTIVLFLHMQPINFLAEMAQKSTFSDSGFRNVRIQLLADAGAALLVLLVLTTISVFKPWGRTSISVREQNGLKEKLNSGEGLNKNKWRKYVLLGFIGLVIILFIVSHLLKGGLSHH
jgi:hypothetical protein